MRVSVARLGGPQTSQPTNQPTNGFANVVVEVVACAYVCYAGQEMQNMKYVKPTTRDVAEAEKLLEPAHC